MRTVTKKSAPSDFRAEALLSLGAIATLGAARSSVNGQIKDLFATFAFALTRRRFPRQRLMVSRLRRVAHRRECLSQIQACSGNGCLLRSRLR